MSASTHTYDFLQPPTQAGDLGMLGTYRILGELGRGGMGFVFRAVDTVLERAVALKVMNKKIASTPNSRDRFLQEARAMAAVHHDNVVVIFEVGMNEGTPFMAMEMLRGETLESINARKAARDYERVIQYACQISRGLAAAHAKGIVHRDIKPANIWVEEGSDRIKILDFGLALASSPAGDTPGMGSVCGTPGYLTPEQARSDPLDDRSDLYSLGVVLYEMCTGRLPTSQAAIAEQLVALLTGTPKPVRELNPEIPAPLADLIHQLLAKEPGDRPANAITLDKRLQEVAKECDAKSEVAVSLNKLQQSLKEVVSKQDEVQPEVIEVAEELPAFDSLALPRAALPPLSPNPATAPLRRAAAPAGKAKPAPAPVAPPVSPLVWAGAGVLGTLVLVLGFVWTLFPGPEANSVVTLPYQSSASPTLTPSEPAAPPQQQPGNAEQVVAATAASNSDELSKQETRRKRQAEEAAAKEEAQRAADEADRRQQENAATTTGQPEPAPEMATEAAPSTPETASDMDAAQAFSAGQDDMPADTADDENEQPDTEIPTRTVRVSTADGSGADSTVRKGSRDSLAMEKLLRVQRLKGTDEDKQHIHVRFDLQTASFEQSQIRAASIGLVLSKPDDEQLNDTTLSLYGYDAPGAEFWIEEDGRKTILWDNSISREGLDSLPQLAEWEFNDLQSDVPNVVFFQSPELTEFIRQAKGKTVSFVISGGNNEGGSVNFFSKQSSPTTAPNLILKVPAP